MTGRRAQNRAAQLVEIKHTALRRLRDHGAAGLTMRGIAADLDLSPGALYRYYDGLDSILTALIADGYHELAAALDRGAADTEDPVEQLRLVARAYRTWALAHRHQFDLVFGTPIPGYAAPAEGPTTEAMEQVGTAMFRPAIEAWERGHLHVPPAYAIDQPGNRMLVDTISAMSGAALPEAFGAWAMAFWGQLHGLVALELNGQFRWIYGDDASAQYDAAVDALLEAIAPPDKVSSQRRA